MLGCNSVRARIERRQDNYGYRRHYYSPGISFGFSTGRRHRGFGWGLVSPVGTLDPVPCLKRIDYIGVTFRTRTVEEVREISRRMREDIWDAVTDRTLHLPLDRTFPLDEAPAAHSHMRANAHFGKIALVM